MSRSKWGQSDMAGNMWEWIQDYYVTPYATNLCNNCANLSAAATNRVIRGGAFNSMMADLYSSARSAASPTAHSANQGARCARNAP